MTNRRNIRKRQFEANKSLRLFRDLSSLYQFLNGDNTNKADFNAFEAQERYENNNKIREMFSKKRKNVIIPEINKKGDKNDKSSEKSAMTDITKDILKSKEEEGPVEFKFEPMGGPPPSYIKYKPRMTPIEHEQNYDKIDYMITEEEWEEVVNSSKIITNDMRDIVEEIFDKLEKMTAKGEVKPYDE